jgi:hypothetical protein
MPFIEAEQILEIFDQEHQKKREMLKEILRQNEICIPTPKFSIGDRVVHSGVADDTHEVFRDEGVITGIFYSLNSPYTEKGWCYYVRFVQPRQYEDDVHESTLEWA